jgi:D-psicose/D-tagatose/L-ribulose 3-epimerase
MKFALCNEVLKELPFAEQCRAAAALGYDRLEVAPFTLAADPMDLGDAQAREFGRVARDHGLEISGLHWLLVAPKGLSITTADRPVREKTVDVMRRLVGLCADLGGDYLVHGSPAQRQTGGDPEAGARGEAAWAAIADDAKASGVTYCIEPLAPRETDFVNTLAEAAVIVGRVGIPAFRTMIDTSAAAQAEAEPVEALVTRWMKTGLVAHVQLNDRNRRGPGQGSDAFTPIVSALKHSGYDGWLAIEPFDYVPDGQACAARAIGYVAGILEAIA